MRKDSLIIFFLTIVLTLGIVGGAHYLYLQNLNRIPDPVSIQPSPVAGATQPKHNIVPPVSRSNSTILKCTQPNGSVFYTNASRCANADLDNTLSVYPSAKPVAPVNKRNTSKSYSSRQDEKTLKSIPREMPFACSFPIGMAQRIEMKSMRPKADPAESVWKDTYCRWVCEARVENCGNLSEYLNLVQLCPQRTYMSKRACKT